MWAYWKPFFITRLNTSNSKIGASFVNRVEGCGALIQLLNYRNLLYYWETVFPIFVLIEKCLCILYLYKAFIVILWWIMSFIIVNMKSSDFQCLTKCLTISDTKDQTGHFGKRTRTRHRCTRLWFCDPSEVEDIWSHLQIHSIFRME